MILSSPSGACTPNSKSDYRFLCSNVMRIWCSHVLCNTIVLCSIIKFGVGTLRYPHVIYTFVRIRFYLISIKRNHEIFLQCVSTLIEAKQLIEISNFLDMRYEH